MAILTGSKGTVKYDPTGAGGAGLIAVISLHAWKLDQKRDTEDVTCFGDTNKVYILGLMDLTGSLEGFWNSAELKLWSAAKAVTPGMLSLQPNSTEATFKWEGLAYLDASIDCSLEAPKVSSNFSAAGPWTTPGT